MGDIALVITYTFVQKMLSTSITLSQCFGDNCSKIWSDRLGDEKTQFEVSSSYAGPMWYVTLEGIFHCNPNAYVLV